MRSRRTVFVFLLVSFVFVIQVFAVTVDEIIGRLEENQEKIRDMSAVIVMQVEVAGKTTTFEVKTWSKGEDKSKIEIFRSQEVIMDSFAILPMTVIMDGSKMSIKQEEKTSHVIDIGKILQDKGKANENYKPGVQFTQGMELQKGMYKFLKKSNVNIVTEKGNEVTLSIIPEESNLLVQKVDMVVDMEKGVITQQKMYSNMGMSFCRMNYEKRDEIWLLTRFTMTSSLGQMGTTTLKMEYKNIKVNKGIADEVFEIE